MAKKARKIRVHRSPFVRIQPTRKLSASEKRQADREKAEKEFPELMTIFNEIKAGLKENLATGERFAYRKSLKEMYRYILNWEKDGCLPDNQEAIARLRGVARRGDANRFSGIVAICSDRDRRTVSRWSQELDSAYEQDIKPRRVLVFLNDPSGDIYAWGDRPKRRAK